MGFRRDGKKAKLWADWQRINAVSLSKSGLPEPFWATEDDWLTFLEHGYYEYFPPVSNPLAWFKIEELSREQLTAVWEIIQAYPKGEQMHVGKLVRHLLASSEGASIGDSIA